MTCRALIRWWIGLAALLLAGCQPKPTVKPEPHYVLGTPYQSAGYWFYPHEDYDLNDTGLAVIMTGNHPALTTDGELFDQTALAGAHPTLQLPAIARLTNLENGLEVTIRLNDRGAGTPHRLVEITRRAATLLGIKDDAVTRVRLQLLPSESRAAAEALPGAPSLGMTAAPRGTVEVAELPPPPGARQAPGRALAATVPAASTETDAAPPPLRLPEALVQTGAQPGQLMVRLDTFSEYRYAALQQAKMRADGGRIVSAMQGRTRQYQVEIGPLPDIARADAVLDQALAIGIPDARITVD